MNPVQVPCYKCSKCGMVWQTEKSAEKCCTPKFCEDCGKELPAKWSRTTCEPCHEKRLFANAVKLTPEQWGGWVYAEGLGDNEGYFDSIDDLINYCEDSEIAVPEWVFCCSSHDHILDIDNALESMLDDAYEDAYDDLTDVGELQKFVHAWNKKQNVTTYSPDYKKVVILLPKKPAI